jgi:hypothetical protein
MKPQTFVVAALTAAVGIPTAYVAWPSETWPRAIHDPQAVQLVKQHPGGTLTGKAEITYARRDEGLPHDDDTPIMVVTFEPTTPARPDCPAAKLCLYATADHCYPRAATEACGYVDLQKLGWARRARSIRNNLPGGDYQAGTVEFVRSDGGPPSDANQHRVLTLDPAARAAVNPPDIDYLYHYC